MISVKWSPKHMAFEVDGDERDVLQDIPFKNFVDDSPVHLKGSGRSYFVVAPIPRNFKYLQSFKAEFTDEAMERYKKLREEAAPEKEFSFKTKPYEHQKRILKTAAPRHAFAYFCDPGTGKTKIGIDDFNAGWKAPQLLVLCPNSVKSSWEEEYDKHSFKPSSTFVWEPGREKALAKWKPAPGVVPVMIVALESLRSDNTVKAVESYIKRAPTRGLADESTLIKNPQAATTKNALRLARQLVERRVASGTPWVNGLHEAWAQFNFLDSRIFLNMTYTVFKALFCQVIMQDGREIIKDDKNRDLFNEIVSPWCALAKKEECLDLPPKVFQKRMVKPTPEMEEMYIRINEIGDDSITTAIVKSLRLHQITGGFYAVEESVQRLVAHLSAGGSFEDFDHSASHYRMEPVPGPNPKAEELLRVTEEMPGKMVIWTRYIPELRLVAESLRKLHGPDAVVEFHGAVPREQRDANRRAFQDDKRVQYFVGQVRSGGIGITLTSADLMLFFSNDWSKERRIQTEDRIHRISQLSQKCLYIDLLIDRIWADRRVYYALASGKDYHEVVMQELKTQKLMDLNGDMNLRLTPGFSVGHPLPLEAR